MFNETPIELPNTIIASDLPTPYITHKNNPTTKTTIKRIETSSVSFVLTAFIIWGTVLTTVKAVAKSPINVNQKSINHFIWYIIPFIECSNIVW